MRVPRADSRYRPRISFMPAVSITTTYSGTSFLPSEIKGIAILFEVRVALRRQLLPDPRVPIPVLTPQPVPDG